MKTTLIRINDFEIPLCLFFNRVNRKALVNRFFRVVSRLGDGVLWYIIMLSLPVLYGADGIIPALTMALTGISGLAIYKLMKTSTRRQRPYHYADDIMQGVRALDQFSFPSGHTLHAVGFSVSLLHFYPTWAVVLVPFAILVALSRLVLGLHYPSDVLIGAGIGYSLASWFVVLMSAGI